MDFFETAAARHSYRGMYLPDPVPREDLRRIMEAGLLAPSGCNQQTTSLIGVDDPQVLAPLAALLKKPHFASAPAAICVLSRHVVAYGETSFSVQDYAAAIQNILLAVTALGYACCWVEGYIKDATTLSAQMEALLGIPEPYHMVAYLPVGRPAEALKATETKPFAQRACFNGFDL